VVDKVAVGAGFSEYFGFHCQSSFHKLLHNHPHLSSGAGTIDQKWPQYKGLSPTLLALKKEERESRYKVGESVIEVNKKIEGNINGGISNEA
jgi:hypothetical protein